MDMLRSGQAAAPDTTPPRIKTYIDPAIQHLEINTNDTVRSTKHPKLQWARGIVALFVFLPYCRLSADRLCKRSDGDRGFWIIWLVWCVLVLRDLGLSDDDPGAPAGTGTVHAASCASIPCSFSSSPSPCWPFTPRISAGCRA